MKKLDLFWEVEQEDPIELMGNDRPPGGGGGCCCCSVPSVITKWLCN